MPSSKSQEPSLGGLPAFADPGEEERFENELDELPADDPGPSQPAAAPSTTSTPPPPPPAAPTVPSPPTSSTTESPSDPDVEAELEAAMRYVGGGSFELMGKALNRMVQRRSKVRTTLWLVNDREAEAFARPVARILDRRIPKELKQGDIADAIIASAVVLDYAGHNMAGFPGTDQPAAQAPAPVPAPAAPAEPAPLAPQPGPAPAAVSVSRRVEAAEPDGGPLFSTPDDLI